MNQTNRFIVFVALTLVSACSKEAPSAVQENGSAAVPVASKPAIVLTQPKPAAVLHATAIQEGLEVKVVTPAVPRRYKRSTGATSPAVESKTLALSEFVRTLEGTHLKLKIQASDAKLMGEDTTFTLMGQGDVLDVTQATLTSSQNTIELEFRTPWIEKSQRESGFQTLTYDILVSNSKHQGHLPFQLTIYDADHATYILPRDTSCSIFNKPEPASGCFQNRTRSTQEVVFNDSVTHSSDVSVSASGGLALTVFLVQAQFGLQKSVTNSESNSRGSEIHFTNCIECASMIFRQTVETVRKGDVYSVQADGSLSWIGDVTYRTKAYAYEFSSTGSESKNYSCEMASQLPVGRTPSCDELGNGL